LQLTAPKDGKNSCLHALPLVLGATNLFGLRDRDDFKKDMSYKTLWQSAFQALLYVHVGGARRQPQKQSTRPE